jgi:hypothetical protein
MPRHCKQFHKMYFSIIVLQLQDTYASSTVKTVLSLLQKMGEVIMEGGQVDISVILAG